MVRVGGMTYTCDPARRSARRIGDMRLGGKPIEAGKRYKVAGWAPVTAGASGEPVWELVQRYLRERKVVARRAPNLPRLIGVEGGRGSASS